MDLRRDASRRHQYTIMRSPFLLVITVAPVLAALYEYDDTGTAFDWLHSIRNIGQVREMMELLRQMREIWRHS